MATFKKLPAFLAAVAAMSAITTSASAAEPTMEVRTADLDLSSAAGQQRLQDRIDIAVRRVCSSNTARPLSLRKSVETCEANARAGAQVQAEQRIALSSGLFARARRVATDN